MSEEANEPEEQALAQNIVQLTIVLPEKPQKLDFQLQEMREYTRWLKH